VISLKDFIRSGSFGPICLGASRESVEQTLGPSDDFSVQNLRRTRKPKILKYGGVELYFNEDDDHVEMAFIDDIDSRSAMIDLWVLNNELLLSEAEGEFRNEEIKYKKAEAPHLPGDTYLITEADVYLHFHQDEGDAPKLVAISKKWNN
jgi:hypothetical protein